MIKKPPYFPKHVEGVVAVIRDSETNYLVIRRAEGVTAPGWWCFPGGGIETGESQEAALIRELREELGLVVRPVSKVWEWTRGDGMLKLHWWASEWVGGFMRPDPSEVGEVRWLSRDQLLMTARLLASNREFLMLG